MAYNTCTASDVFYHKPDTLREELRVAIARAAAQGEDYLIELSNQICICLQVNSLQGSVNLFRPQAVA